MVSDWSVTEPIGASVRIIPNGEKVSAVPRSGPGLVLIGFVRVSVEPEDFLQMVLVLLEDLSRKTLRQSSHFLSLFSQEVDPESAGRPSSPNTTRLRRNRIT